MKSIYAQSEPQDFMEDKPVIYIVTKERMKSILKEGIVTVTFTKIDGSPRVMNCTLQPEFLPKKGVELLLVEARNERADNPNAIAVWDIDSEGWRSFRLDSVKSVIFNSMEIDSE